MLLAFQTRRLWETWDLSNVSFESLKARTDGTDSLKLQEHSKYRHKPEQQEAVLSAGPSFQPQAVGL